MDKNDYLKKKNKYLPITVEAAVATTTQEISNVHEHTIPKLCR